MKILAIDFNSLMNRSFFAIRSLTTKDGFPTNALTGFVKTYGKLLHTFSPDGVFAAYDLHAPTFRHQLYGEYKGTRSPMAEELRAQIPLGREFVSLAGGIPLGIEGFEADDILGTLGDLCRKEGHTCIIATGDRDSLQLVDENVFVNLATNKGDILYTPEKVLEQYGVSPKQLIDVKALMGDSSDNIPGVKGIGEKTALSLVCAGGSLSHILENLEDLPATPRIKNLILTHKEDALLSYTLGEIKKDVPLPVTLEDAAAAKRNDEKLSAFFTQYELNSAFKAFQIEPSGLAPSLVTPKVTAVAATHLLDPDLKTVSPLLGDTLPFLCTFDGETLSSFSIALDQNTAATFTEEVEKRFQTLVLRSPLPKLTFDAKPVYRYAFQRGLSLSHLTADLKLAAYLLSSDEKTYTLSALREHYCPDAIFDLPDEAAGALTLPKIWPVLSDLFQKRDMTYLYQEIELPLCEVLASMEEEGFMVDEDGITKFGETLKDQIDVLVEEITLLAGESFNINSTKSLSEILFHKLGLPPKKKTKSGYSTDVEVLESLLGKHPIIEKILDYRKLTKLMNTYVVGLKKCIQKDGRIHSTFNQTETRTGRISSADPNIQNIPVRTPLGAEMRKFFVAKEGFTLVDADYSQIELRILAHISGDERMIEGFQNGADIHRMTASQVFGIPFDQVPSSLRSQAKAINFGIVYGISPFSLSQDIHVTVKEAKRYIDDYLSTYSGVDRYMKESVEKARKDGYVETLFHRPRFLPDIHSKKPALRGFSERVAMNMPIQGTAADVIKLSMIRVYRRLKEEKLSSRLILQVHDELLVETALSEVEQVKRIVKEEMENAVHFSVKLEADCHDGKNWYEAKE